MGKLNAQDILQVLMETEGLRRLMAQRYIAVLSAHAAWDEGKIPL